MGELRISMGVIINGETGTIRNIPINSYQTERELIEDLEYILEEMETFNQTEADYEEMFDEIKGEPHKKNFIVYSRDTNTSNANAFVLELFENKEQALEYLSTSNLKKYPKETVPSNTYSNSFGTVAYLLCRDVR